MRTWSLSHDAPPMSDIRLSVQLRNRLDRGSTMFESYWSIFVIQINWKLHWYIISYSLLASVFLNAQRWIAWGKVMSHTVVLSGKSRWQIVLVLLCTKFTHASAQIFVSPCQMVRPWEGKLTDRYTQTETNGTDSITSTTDVVGKNRESQAGYHNNFGWGQISV